MKPMARQLNDLFKIVGRILSAIILYSTIAASQQSKSPDEFIIGAKLGNGVVNLQETFNSFVECGFNSIWWEAYSDTKPFLDKLNITTLAENGRSRKDYIHHYATGYYSRWEAEQDQTFNRVGLKHKYGKATLWNGVNCWSSIGLSSPKDSLVYGPHYRQDKRYKRWIYKDKGWNRYDVKYNVRFRMALSYKPGSVSNNEDVCVIKVVFRYSRVYPGGWDPPEDIVLIKRTLKVKDFATGGNFNYIYFDKPYEYPDKFDISEIYHPAKTDFTYDDNEPGLGIQFRVDWLRKDKLCTLYLDHVEVYDNDGWNDVIKDSKGTAEKIKRYAESFPTDYPYIKYFFANDEPYSIDGFMPYHVVDSIITVTTGIPLITEFNPYWTHDGKINGEDFLQLWYDIGKPQKLMIDFYPFSPEYPFRLDDAEALRLRFQKCHTLQPGFWYSAQAFGVQLNNKWQVWRMPDTTEFNASVMLALAHGVKGLMLFSFESFNEVKGIVNNNQTQFTKSHLWYLLKYSIIPRLKGKFGKKLMELDYTGNYIQYFKVNNKQSTASQQSTKVDFLTLSFLQTQSEQMNWHCGIFSKPEHPDDKYFLLTNIYTLGDSRDINIQLRVSGTEYKNHRLRNIEGSFDTTFTSQFTSQYNFSQGEGYLYQVAPVVKYGGKLIYSEATKEGMELTDDLIIENGAVLTIDGNYYANANIIVKNGKVSYKNKGKIHFAENKRLIRK